MGIPGNAAELDIILGTVGADIHRESSFQQHMLLVPVDVGGKVDAAAVGVEGDILHELRPGNGAFQMQAAADRAVLGHSQAGRTVRRKAVAAVVFFQVPGVVLVGAVLKQLQLVGALPGRDQLAAGTSKKRIWIYNSFLVVARIFVPSSLRRSLIFSSIIHFPLSYL